MRRMTLFAFAGLLALPAAARTATAPRMQEPAPSERPARGEFRELGLTEDQKQKIREIREQHPNDPQARRKAILEVLTPEQREKLKAMRRRRREARRAPEDPAD